jgi:hypothetical protein
LLSRALRNGPRGTIESTDLADLAALYLAHPDDPQLLGHLALAVALAGGTSEKERLTSEVPRLTEAGAVLWESVKKFEERDAPE